MACVHGIIGACTRCQEKQQLARVTKQRDELLEAAQAVVDRWDSPTWKDTQHTAVYINLLRTAITYAKDSK